MKKIIGGKQYDTEKAELVADNSFTDGSNRLNHGRAMYLYKTKKGNFFCLYVTCWQGEHDSIKPLTIDEAKELFEELASDEDWPKEFGIPEEA